MTKLQCKDLLGEPTDIALEAAGPFGRACERCCLQQQNLEES
jgi:hypothetical protein